MPSILAFAALSVVLVVLPGPAVMLVLKSAVARGRRPALLTASGVLAADLVWAGASVAGLTALLVASRPVFDLVRYLGAAYLVYLGVKLMLTRSIRPAEARSAAGGRRAFREGLLSDLSNPKTIIVFTSVIPQFMGHDARPVDALILGIVFAVAGFLSLVSYALVFSAATKLLRDARLTRAILRVGGAILAAFGIGLAVERPGV